MKLRNFFIKKEKQKLINKFLFINFCFSLTSTSYNKLLLLNYFSSKISKTQLKNRCVVTGRGSGVNKYYSLSRIIMRDFIQFGILPGYKKSVW